MSNRPADHHLVMAAIEARPKPIKADRKRVVKESPLADKTKKGKLPQRRKAKPNPDYWFSLCVRERAGWNCESCGKHYESWVGKNGEPANPALHCSHYIGRANYAVRFEPLNVNAHCYYCHSQFEGNPHEFKEWKLNQLGQEKYDIVIEKSHDLMLGKQARKEKQEIADHYKQQFYLMKLKVITDFVGY